MKKNDLKNILNDETRKLNSEATSIGYTTITIYIVLLAVLQYIKDGILPYNLFSIFFISEFSQSLYKYTKTKNKSYLIELIACFIAFGGLVILMI